LAAGPFQARDSPGRAEAVEGQPAGRRQGGTTETLAGLAAALGVPWPSPASSDHMGSRFSNALQVLEWHACEKVAEGST
jgi:hypothetical protein